MKRFLMVLLGFVVMVCLLSAWVLPLLRGADVQRVRGAVSDWAKGDNGDFLQRQGPPLNSAQPWGR
jgi:hypothetical protein